MEYVIIGNSAAGTKTAETLRKLEPNSIITIISEEADPPYSRCLISWYVDESLKRKELYFKTDRFYDDFNIKAILGQRITKIDRENANVTCNNGLTVHYDKLLIATGSRPFRPPISGTEHHNILNFHSLFDAETIAQSLKSVDQVIIIGAGFVGLEAAYAIARKGKKVTVVERLPNILPSNFDEEASKIFLRDLEKSNIKVITGKSVISIEGNNGIVVGVSLSDGSSINCQLIILATGVRPNSEIASDAGLDVNSGIVVDEFLKTNDPNIFAAGDVIEIYDITSGRRVPSGTWYNANVQGKFAAYNMAGQKRRYTRAVGVQSAVEFREVPAISFGKVNISPLEDNEYDTIINLKGNVYRKLILKGEILVGMIFVGDIINSGFYAKLIRNQINIGKVKEKLLQPDFSYTYFKHMEFEEESPYI